jgi:hypothetical protein
MPACRQAGNTHYYHLLLHKHDLYGYFIMYDILDYDYFRVIKLNLIEIQCEKFHSLLCNKDNQGSWYIQLLKTIIKTCGKPEEIRADEVMS